MSTLSRTNKADRRLARTRAKISGTTERPRLCVVRSLKHISAQIIDDVNGKTLAAASDTELSGEAKAKKLDKALALGKLIAERAKAKGVTTIVFDRRDKRYHGRIRAVAEGAREGGLIF